ncbi:MAG: dihydropyrimidinase [Bosea sp. (in: a-proteobacteria)]
MPTATQDLAHDLVIRNGTVVTATDVFKADVGIKSGKIAALGAGLPPGLENIDARGKLVLPGGIDSHTHIEQLSAGGLMNADTFESATRAAAFGGTTTVMSFAAQHKGMSLRKVVDDYAVLAARGAMVDYAFHMIVSDPTEATLSKDLPALIAEGHSSIKLFMTYDKLKVEDETLLDVLAVAREQKALVCVHAENHGMIAWMSRKLLAKGKTAPKYHAMSHPRASETEAFTRLISAAALVDQPIMIFHVSTAEGAAIVGDARRQGLKVFAETCPQYLFLTADDLDKPGLEGAKFMCSPPPRERADQEALWAALALGDLQTVSSDHAPYRYDASGKLSGGPNSTFKQIANGLPGLETRMPLIFDAMVSKKRPEFAGHALQSFVNLTATQPAKIYNLANKGNIAIGLDADIAIWDANRRVVLTDDLMVGNTGYTPFAGRTVKGWPDTVMVRGKTVASGGEVTGVPGSGKHIPRSGGWAADPAR